MKEPKCGELWVNGLNEIVEITKDMFSSKEYPLRCYKPGTDIFLFSCTKGGKWNRRFDTDSDLIKRVTREENPEYFL